MAKTKPIECGIYSLKDEMVVNAAEMRIVAMALDHAIDNDSNAEEEIDPMVFDDGERHQNKKDFKMAIKIVRRIRRQIKKAAR